MDTFVQFCFSKLGFFFVLLFQFLITFFVNFSLKEISCSVGSSLERNLVIKSICFLTLVNLWGRSTFWNIWKLWHLSTFTIPVIFTGSIVWDWEIKLWPGASNTTKLLGFIHWRFWLEFRVVFTTQWSWSQFSFCDDPWSTYLVNSKFTASIVIKTLD